MREFYQSSLLLFLIPFFTILSINLSAQELLWQADFSGSGNTSGSGTNNSTLDGDWNAAERGNPDNRGEFGTSGGRFVLNDIEGSQKTGCAYIIDGGRSDNTWIANIDTRGYCNLSFEMGVRAVGAFETAAVGDGCSEDRMIVSWGSDFDGGSLLAFAGSPGNGFNRTLEEVVGSSSRIQIRVEFGNQSLQEFMYIDYLRVFGEASFNASPANTEACSGERFQFVVAGAPADYDYSWIGPNNFSSNEARPVINNVELADAGLYEVIISDPSSNCSVILEYPLEVFPSLPQPARLNISNDIACKGETILLTATPSSNDFEYVWIGPDGEEITECRNSRICRLSNVEVADQGPYLVQILAPDLGPCAFGEAEGELFVADGPGNVSAEPDPFCVGQNATINVQTQNSGNFTYTWIRVSDNQELAANNNGSLTINNIQKSDEGLYFLLVSNEDGTCSVEANNQEGVLVIVNDGLAKPVITTAGNACEGLVELEVEIEEGQIANWFNENNTEVAENTATYQPTAEGRYYVAVFDPTSFCESPRSDLFLVEEKEGVTASINTSSTQLCEGATTTITASGGTSYLWDNGATSPSINVGSGTYQVTVSNSDNCTSTASITIEQFPDFATNIVGDSEICNDENSTLTASGGAQYRWNTNATSSTIQVGAGDYSVTITSANGCEKVETFSVEQFPDFATNIVGDSEICNDENSTLTASGGAQYRWNTNATSSTIQVGAGDYSVTITSANGCEKVENFSVEQFPDFATDIVGDSEICNDENSTLTASGGAQYRWNTNATSSTIQVGAGDYSVTITSANGCEKVETFSVEEFPIFEAQITGETTICGIENTTLTATEGTTYLWSNGATTQDVNVNAGTYSVTITNANNCISVSKDVTVTQNPLPSFSIASSAVCSDERDTYQIDITTEVGNIVEASAGMLIEGANGLIRIILIPAGEDIEIQVRNEFGCVFTQFVTAPDCSCPVLAAPMSNGNLEICEGAEIPTLSVTTNDEDLTTNWYDAASGGNLLASNTNTFTPENAGIYYAETVEAASACKSSTRTAIQLIINELPQLLVSESTSIDCNNSTANITLVALGENAPYQFALNDNDFQTENIFEGLEEGVYTISVQDSKGCTDEITTTISSNFRSDVQNIESYSCNPTNFGVDTTFLINELGCDSLVIETTLDGRSTPMIFNELTCDNEQALTDTLILQNQFNCDSLIITNYTLASSDTTFLVATSCDPNNVGTRILNLQNQAACDSVVVINTSFSDKDVISFTELVCDPSIVGIDTAAFINQIGCDSLVITERILRGLPDTTFLQAITCDFNSVGIDTLYLMNQNACDSIVITEKFFAFPPPPDLILPTELTVCQGDTILLSTDSYTSGLQWTKDGADITNGTNNELMVTESGIYGVSYTNEEGCTVVSGTVEIVIIDGPIEPVFSNKDNLLQLEKEDAFAGFTFQWFLNGIPIDEATNTVYCAKESGSYSLEVTDPNTACSSIFTMEIIHDSGIENCTVNTFSVLDQYQIQLYPNPHQAHFTLTYNLNKKEQVALEIIDVLGRVCYKEQLNATAGENNHRIQTTNWTAGIYLLQIRVNGATKTMKVIKG